MKKNLLFVLMLSMVVACGCSNNEAKPATETATIGNPWIDCSQEDIQEKLDLPMYAPAGVSDAKCQMNETEGLAQMTFKYGEPELEYTFRMKKAQEMEDISGLYYEWTVEENQTIGWSDGVCKRAITDDETVDLCMWFDQNMEIMYSLSTSASDLDGFDITAVVSQLFIQEDESDVFMPSNFLESKLMKDEFSSFDEIISSLDKGNAYAIVKVYGWGDDVLMIAEGAYDNLDGNMASIEGCLYINDNGKVRSAGNVYSSGTAYPISLDKDGRIYSGGNHDVSVSALAAETSSVMNIVYAYESFDENQNVTYGGFVRETNSLDEEGANIAEDDSSVLDKWYKDYAETTPVNYTVVE